MPNLNETHDPAATSWVQSANQDTDFPVQNLPFGVFRQGGGEPQGGIAIGDQIVDLKKALAAGLFSGEGEQAAKAASGPLLNALFDLPASATSALRRQLFAALKTGGAGEGKDMLVAQSDVEMVLPVKVGAFSDFLCSVDHTKRMSGGTLPPSFNYQPIAYNSRATSVIVGGDVRRPLGQAKDASGEVIYGPEPMLDYELEVGVVLREGNAMGEPMTMAEAERAIFGYCVLNDWSARGIQFLEGQPLGPFLGKSFATTISPWIVTAEALAPFGVAAHPHVEGAPTPASYLMDEADQASGNINIELECLFTSEAMRRSNAQPARLVKTNAAVSYWTFAQMVAHHSSNGCNLQPGDLMGSGTLSGPTDESRACLAESTQRGTVSFDIPGGETRMYLEDGDEVLFVGRATAPGAVSIGFGECRGRISPAPNRR